MYKFMLTGNGPVTNRGCEAIVLGTQKILEREFGAIDFLLASFAQDQQTTLPGNVHPVALDYQRPRWSSAWWQYQISNRFHLKGDQQRFLRPLKGRLQDIQAAFSIGGDGYAIDDGHFIVDHLVIMDNYLKAYGIPLVIWGASIGPFDQEPEFERQMAQHLSRIDLVVVREPVSLAYLHRLGVVENVCLAPDPAFVLDPVPCDLPDEVTRLLVNPCLGVNLSPLIATYVTGHNLRPAIALAVGILEQLLTQTGLPLILISHVTSPKYDPRLDDDLFLRGVYSALPSALTQRVAVVPRGLSSANLKWIIGRTTAFIGARAHAMMAALSVGVPCLSIAYSRKAWGINEFVFGHSEWVISFGEISSVRFHERVLALLQNRERIQAQLQRVIPEMVEHAYQAAKRVRTILADQQVRS